MKYEELVALDLKKGDKIILTVDRSSRWDYRDTEEIRGIFYSFDERYVQYRLPGGKKRGVRLVDIASLEKISSED